MTTQRKPYVRTMTPTRWQKLGFYRFYMLREGTSVLAVWFSIVLLYGVFALKGGAESWAGFVGFLQNPLVLLINVVALLAAALHTKTGSIWRRRPPISWSTARKWGRAPS